MKNLLSLFLSSFLFLSCGEVNVKTINTVNKEDNRVEIIGAKKKKNHENIYSFEENLLAFNNCKKNEIGKGKCKEYIAKAVCEYYGIDDLKDNGNYLDYDKIPKRLKELKSWNNLGDFNENNLNKALEKLNNFNKPVLIFNKDASYVHVVALTPNGKSIKSGKWGNILVPTCVSYFPKRNDSFTEKGMNYAFKSSENLTIWVKN